MGRGARGAGRWLLPVLAMWMVGTAAAVPADLLGSSGVRKEALPDHARGRTRPLGEQLPFLIVPPRPNVVCPKCDEIYAEIWELTLRRGDFFDMINHRGILNYMQDQWTTFCMKSNPQWNDYECDYQGEAVGCCSSVFVGCYVATGNSTQFGQAATCENVPFRELAHAVTGYALNGSNMSIVIPVPKSAISPYRPLPPDFRFDITVPNSWFVQMTVMLHNAINALPPDAWHALKLGDTMPAPGNPSEHVPTVPPYPSLEQVFGTLLANKTASYMKATASSWPWVPPPPPPPPTPPPCPGGSLQECMNLCPKAPVEDYKTCVKSCLDVCHTESLT